VKGSQKTPCNFAYLEHPQFQGKDGKLVIRARFSGRSSLNMFGQCVGLGDGVHRGHHSPRPFFSRATWRWPA